MLGVNSFVNRAKKMATKGLSQLDARNRRKMITSGYDGPFIIEKVEIFATKNFNGVVFYCCSISRRDGTPGWQIDLRYSDIAQAKAQMDCQGVHADRAKFFLNPQHKLPNKNVNARQLHLFQLNEGEIEQRRAALENFLQERITFVHRKDRDPAWVQENHLNFAVQKIENALNCLFRVHEHIYGFTGFGDNDSDPTPRGCAGRPIHEPPPTR